MQCEQTAPSLPVWIWTAKNGASWESGLERKIPLTDGKTEKFLSKLPQVLSLFFFCILQILRGEEMPWNTQFCTSISEVSAFGESWFFITTGKTVPQYTPLQYGLKHKRTGPLVQNGRDLRLPRQTFLGKWTNKLGTNIEKIIEIEKNLNNNWNKCSPIKQRLQWLSVS